MQDYPQLSAGYRPLYQRTQFDDPHEMSPVIQQTGNVFRGIVQFFSGDSGATISTTPLLSVA
ncbi:hypothetical protein QUA81_11960 [Microcoleus sp. F6_B4]